MKNFRIFYFGTGVLLSPVSIYFIGFSFLDIIPALLGLFLYSTLSIAFSKPEDHRIEDMKKRLVIFLAISFSILIPQQHREIEFIIFIAIISLGSSYFYLKFKQKLKFRH